MRRTASELAAAPRLEARRVTFDEWHALAGGVDGLLGGVAYGLSGNGDGAAEQSSLPPLTLVHARLIEPSLPQVDAWLAGGRLVEGRSGAAHWRHDGQWLFGALALDESGSATEGLAALTRRAYGEVFAALRATGPWHLVRIWNYLGAINEESGGLERYRQFNLGRHEAFVEAGQAAGEGAPAACALGTHGGPLCVSFLAARDKPLAIENPRQIPAWRYPVDYGPSSPTFSRAALADAGDGCVALFVSGTASIVGHASVNAGDIEAQTRETLANMRAVTAAARMHCTAPFELAALEVTGYVRRAAHAQQVRRILADELGADARATRNAVLLEADICRAELLVEIEAYGFSAGTLRR
jgi:enamine deaminase RidA (YjgF/YER057c/UK114 family)